MPSTILLSLPCQQPALGKTCGCDVTSRQPHGSCGDVVAVIWALCPGIHSITRWRVNFWMTHVPLMTPIGATCWHWCPLLSQNLFRLLSDATASCLCSYPLEASGNRRYLPPDGSPQWGVTPASIFLAAPRLWFGSQCQSAVVGYSPQMSFSVYISPYQDFFLTPLVSGFGGGRAMSWDYPRHPFSSRRAGAIQCQTAP